MAKPTLANAALSNFTRDKDGAITVFGLFLTATMIVVGGLAVDVANGYLARTELQAAADSAAHTAIYRRESLEPEDARAAAIEMANEILYRDGADVALNVDDIQFGHWDAAAQAFQIDEDSRDAVLVTTNRTRDRKNGVSTHLLKLAGFDNFDVRSTSLFLAEVPGCLTEGFVAVGPVDMQSGNDFLGAFCVHSNTSVSFNNNNYFSEEAIVSMPNLEMLDIPNKGYEKNEGLENALREGYYNIRVLNHLETIMDNLTTFGSIDMPDYIGAAGVLSLDNTKSLTADDFTPGRMHSASCSSGQTLSIKGGETIRNAVLVTNCKISFGAGAALENAVFATRNTDAKSITGASGFRLGAPDNCADGGGAQLITLGGAEFPANLQMYNGQILARGSVEFAAQANGMKGASIVAGNQINGTSETAMGYCGTGMADNFKRAHFRMAL